MGRETPSHDDENEPNFIHENIRGDPSTTRGQVIKMLLRGFGLPRSF